MSTNLVVKPSQIPAKVGEIAETNEYQKEIVNQALEQVDRVYGRAAELRVQNQEFAENSGYAVSCVIKDVEEADDREPGYYEAEEQVQDIANTLKEKLSVFNDRSGFFGQNFEGIRDDIYKLLNSATTEKDFRQAQTLIDEATELFSASVDNLGEQKDDQHYDVRRISMLSEDISYDARKLYLKIKSEIKDGISETFLEKYKQDCIKLEDYITAAKTKLYGDEQTFMNETSLAKTTFRNIVEKILSENKDDTDKKIE